MSGSFNIGAGFSQTQGFVFNLGLTMDNLNGTGESLAVNFNNEQANKVYSPSFTDPYHTIDAISRTVSFSYRERDAAEEDISNYFENSYGANLDYGIPLTEYDRLRIGVGYQATDIIRGGTNVTADVDAFLDEYTEGSVNANGVSNQESIDYYTGLGSCATD